MKSLLGSVALATGAMLCAHAPSALASEGHTCPASAQGTPLDKPALARTLSGAGLTQTGGWEHEDGCVETRARTADGRSVEVILDPYTGAILHRAEERRANRERNDNDRGRDQDDGREKDERRS